MSSLEKTGQSVLNADLEMAMLVGMVSLFAHENMYWEVGRMSFFAGNLALTTCLRVFYCLADQMGW